MISLDIGNSAATIGNAFLRNRGGSNAGGVGTNSPAAQSGQRSAFGGTTMGPTNTGYNPNHHTAATAIIIHSATATTTGNEQKNQVLGELVAIDIDIASVSRIYSINMA